MSGLLLKSIGLFMPEKGVKVQIHAVVSVFQGVPEGVKAFLNREEAEIALGKARKEMGIEVGAETESLNHVELFYNVPVQGKKKGG